jgi:hypothetical protein
MASNSWRMRFSKLDDGLQVVGVRGHGCLEVPEAVGRVELVQYQGREVVAAGGRADEV